MRISFSLPLVPESGKQVFACRLSKALQKKGVTVTDKKPDINLIIVKGARDGCKNVLRLDGVWMNKTDDNLKNKNKKIRNLINSCEGVIYQNEFCKEASDKLIRASNKKYAIIGNGISEDELFCADKYKHPRMFFLAMCKWRPHKRLKDTVNGFINSKVCGKYDLIVLGTPDYKVKHPNVIYLGDIPNSKLLSILMSDWCSGTVHLAYIDWCPNSVVESIVAKKNVLHTSSGGTKLIVKDNGIRIKDKEWDFSITNLYKPPPLDAQEVSESYNKMVELPAIGNRVDLHIDTIADKYIEFFKRVLS